jgi:predicted lysophospholipase L1 biosynthesis ABC-type transport system permease subunit
MPRRDLFDAQLLQNAVAVIRTVLVLAGFAGFLVQFAALRVG